MIRAFLLRRLTDIASAALFGLDADRAAVRGLAEHVAAGWVEIGSLRLHLREARRIAHEQEDRAERAEAAHAADDERNGNDQRAMYMRAIRAEIDAKKGWEAAAAEQAKAPTAADIDAAKQWASGLHESGLMPVTDWAGDTRERLSALLLRLARVTP